MFLLRRCLALVPLPLLPACGGGRAPSFLLFGSYFPSWLLGAAVSIPITLLFRLVLIRTGIDDALPLRLLVYVCFALVFTMAFAYLLSPR